MAKILDNTITCPLCNCKFKVEKEDVETIKGWLARDKDGSLAVYLYIKPYKAIGRDNIPLDYWYNNKPCIDLDENLYPEVTWNTEPKEIEVQIIFK